MNSLKSRVQEIYSKFYELVYEHVPYGHYPCCCSTLSCAIEGLDKYVNKEIFKKLKEYQIEFDLLMEKIKNIDPFWYPDDD